MQDSPLGFTQKQITPWQYGLKLLAAIVVVQLIYWVFISPISQRAPLGKFGVPNKIESSVISAPTLDAVKALPKSAWQKRKVFWYDCCDNPYHAFRYFIPLSEHPKKDLGLIASIGADNYHIWINGYAFYDRGDLANSKHYQKWTRGVQRVSSAMLHKGDNEVLIISARHGGGYTDLYPQRFGDYEKMKKAAARRSFFVNDFRIASMLLYGLIAFFALVTLPASKNREFAIWLAVLTGALCLRIAYMRWHSVPFSPQGFTVYWFVLTAFIGISWFNLLDVWSGRGAPKLRLLVTGLGILVIVVDAIAIFNDKTLGYELASTLNDIFLGVCAVLAALLFLYRIFRYRPRRYFEIAVFLLALMAMALDSASKFLSAWWSGGNLNHMLPFLALMLVAAFLSHNVKIFESLGAFNADLNARLKASEQEIKVKYQQLREVRKARDLAEDRQRILRDMHDGIGNHLTGLLVQARSDLLSPQDMKRGIETALNDLRLVVSSLDTQNKSFLAAMTALKSQFNRQLEAAGIIFNWEMDIETTPVLDVRSILNLSRILQEAVTNVIRHSTAKTVSIMLKSNQTNELLIVEVVDDGKPISTQKNAHGGQGLKNMRSRAAALGAEIEIGPKSDGFHIRLEIPLSTVN